MNKFILGFLLLFLALTGLNSCGDNCVYQDIKDIPEDGWKKDDALAFEYVMNDTTDCYEIVVDVNSNYYINGVKHDAKDIEFEKEVKYYYDPEADEIWDKKLEE